MKIYIITRGYPNETDPQWGCFERDQALALKQIGHSIVMISVDTRFRRYHRKYGITKAVHGDIPHYDLFAGSLWGKALRSISVKVHTIVKHHLITYLFKHVAKQEGMPDLIYGHYLGGCVSALAIKRAYGIPAVGIEHWSKMGFNPILKKYRILAAKTYPFLDKQLVVSEALRNNILNNVGVDTMVVHNMIGQSFMDNIIEKKSNQSTIRIISVGSLLHVKGYDILIDALNIISDKLPKWELVLVGEGKERISLQKQIDQYGLSDKIKMIGRKNKDEIIRLLNGSSMYVSSSRSENFSVSIIEALSAGLPVVATECGGIKECLNEKNGILAPVEDAKGLAVSILTMVDNINRYDRQYISEQCKGNFGPNAIAEKLNTVFEEVIRKSKK